MYRQTQALRESLGASDTQAAALHRKVEQLRKALADNQAAADTAQQQVWPDAVSNILPSSVVYRACAADAKCQCCAQAAGLTCLSYDANLLVWCNGPVSPT